MIGHVEKGLKLSSALRQGNPPALQVHQALHRRILGHQELEGVVVQHRHCSSLRAGQDVGLCGGQLRTPVLQHSQVLDRTSGLEKSNANPRVVPLHHRLQRVTQDVAFSARCACGQREMFRP